MRNVKIKSFGAKNFGPFVGDIDCNVEDGKITLIKGPNGSGKTTLMETIPFTFFGSSTKNFKIEDVVNNAEGNNCRTFVNFEIDNICYEAFRYVKYLKLGNTTLIKKNGIDYLKGANETVPELEKLICDKKLFMQTLMFGQKVKDLFADLGEADKREVFRKIIKTDDFILWNKQGKLLKDSTENHLQKILRDIELYKQTIRECKENIENLEEKRRQFVKTKQEKIQSIHNEINELKRQKQNVDEEISKYEKEINEKNKESIEEILISLNNKKDNLREKIKTVRESYEKDSVIKLLEEKRLCETRINELEKEVSQKINELKYKIRDLENEKESIVTNVKTELKNLSFKNDKLIEDINLAKEKINELQNSIVFNEKEECVCPLCKQDIGDKQKDIFVLIIDEEKLKIEDLNKEIENMKTKSNTLKMDGKNNVIQKNKEIEIITSEIDNLEEAKTIRISQEKTAYKIKVESIKREMLLEINEKINSERKELDSLDIEINETKKEIIEKQKTMRELEIKKEDLKELEGHIKSNTVKISTIEEQRFDNDIVRNLSIKIKDNEKIIKDKTADIQKVTRRVELINFWRDGFSPSGIPSMLIDDALPFMNERVSYYLDKLSNGRYFVSFSNIGEDSKGKLKDKIEINFLDKENKSNKKSQFSGGQTRLVDIATILTLSDLQSRIQNVKFNILIFDEIFDSLDDENIKSTSDLLREVVKDKSIFVISHRHIDSLEADSEINLF